MKKGIEMFIPNKEWGINEDIKDEIYNKINELEKKQNYILLPKETDDSGIFFALKDITPSNVKVIIIGQDPYPSKYKKDGKYRADGMAFSFGSGEEAQDSLKNIFDKIRESEIDEKNKKVDDKKTKLTCWKKQGVLLLNTSLIYTHYKDKTIWQSFWKNYIKGIIDEVIKSRTEKEKPKPLVIMLWGRDANLLKWFNVLEKNKKNLILRSSHPSNNHGANNKRILKGEVKAFSECNHFKDCNDFLKENGEEEINWST